MRRSIHLQLLSGDFYRWELEGGMWDVCGVWSTYVSVDVGLWSLSVLLTSCKTSRAPVLHQSYVIQPQGKTPTVRDHTQLAVTLAAPVAPPSATGAS